MIGKRLDWLIAAWVAAAGLFCLIEMAGEMGFIDAPNSWLTYSFRCLYVILLAGSIVKGALSFMRGINNRLDGGRTNKQS